MISGQTDSLRLFRFRGIQVYLHWMWFLIAFYEISTRSGAYRSLFWNIAEYLALFVIVLLHEFGHAFACRQTGGKAEKIVLWPLGGVAFVQPPPRATAELWSIAAGPLVNVVLFPILMGAVYLADASGLSARLPDFAKFLFTIWWINRGLLIFNLLPIYPLDGGQILRSLLWLRFGRARSLLIATMIGFVGVPLFTVYALLRSGGSNLPFVLVMAYFLGSGCVSSFRQARALLAIERLPAHRDFTCPTCRQSPPAAAFWLCPSCGHRFDAFATAGSCPHCQTRLPAVRCIFCGTDHAIEQWEKFLGGVIMMV
jgi:Zn-dependent protease